jgi:hypothetical protein
MTTLMKSSSALANNGSESEKDPVRVDLVPTDRQKRRIIRRYYATGYAVFEFKEPVGSTELLRFLSCFSLWQPCVPRQYMTRPTVYGRQNFNVIGIPAGSSSTVHRAFETSLSQALHCDGTLEEIGAIATAVLYCMTAAPSGGETLVFESARAFKALSANTVLAEALTSPNALMRTDVGYTEASYVGPAFRVDRRGIVSRFSLDNTCDWENGRSRVRSLDVALDRMSELAQPESPFSHEFRLCAGQGVMFANDRVAHGRRAYVDSPSDRRRMLRVLYDSRPA